MGLDSQLAKVCSDLATMVNLMIEVASHDNPPNRDISTEAVVREELAQCRLA
jgi:hypothetical protein